MAKQIRQGDVYLRKVEITDRAKLEKVDTKGDVILAFGEKTGHAHRIAEGTATEYKRMEQRLIEIIEGGTKLTHEEHSPLELESGFYEVVQQREYSPFDENESRFVVD